MSLATEDIGLEHHRQDGADNDVPVIVQRYWLHRLYIDDVLGLVIRADAGVDVVLRRQADHVGAGVQCRLGELGVALCAGRLVLPATVLPTPTSVAGAAV